MKILVACEESQAVTAYARECGHDAWSCDLFPCSGPMPEYHLQQDVLPLLEKNWDAIIAFPPCTHLSSSGARWWKEKQADGRQQKAIWFFQQFARLDHVQRVAIENPIGIMSSLYRKPDQIVQPWQFGHGEMKGTCLWLKGLAPLEPTDIVDGRTQKVWRMPPSAERAKLRSKTYSGIARAMVDQWFNSPNAAAATTRPGIVRMGGQP